MATWGGSTQCALDEEDGDEDYLSDGLDQAEEEEEDASSSNDSFSVYPNNHIPENMYFLKENKDRWVALFAGLVLVWAYLGGVEEALHQKGTLVATKWNFFLLAGELFAVVLLSYPL